MAALVAQLKTSAEDSEALQRTDRGYTCQIMGIEIPTLLSDRRQRLLNARLVYCDVTVSTYRILVAYWFTFGAAY